ncbi:hypothetical protein [Moritella viscosa]|uniref:Uncharacterized protein n=1 Tax=Moritella viscosa TaxID=80854 RepID=A0ABY1HGU1_9GAMM|nr:hypothetical protein [Moritella viscosa]SGY96690.1 Putative uncharacterized protein [Moritella viscosa]SGZ09155.1 Putative uncharacterized protein [Moritella viscosa]SGZ15417.1 Putative uncharacterized protein [Moritella viscosa]SHO28260.1 Putative uncharacterized protein [Moritella viscosa]
MNRDVTGQALEAFIAEAKKAGLDIEEYAKRAQTGIMGNAVYSWISVSEKSKVIKALNSAVDEVSKLDV